MALMEHSNQIISEFIDAPTEIFKLQRIRLQEQTFYNFFSNNKHQRRLPIISLLIHGELSQWRVPTLIEASVSNHLRGVHAEVGAFMLRRGEVRGCINCSVYLSACGGFSV